MKASRCFSGGPDWKPCEGRISRRLPGAGAYRVQADEHDTGSLATVPAVTVAVHHASWERDPESTAAKAGRWPGGSGPGTVKGAVLKPAPADVHVPAAYRREPGGQPSGHVPASPVTAAARLRLSHHSTAPGKAPARKIPAGSGRRALTWPNTTPPELPLAPAQIGSHPQHPAAMIWPHTA